MAAVAAIATVVFVVTVGWCPGPQFSELEAQWLHTQAGAFRDEIEAAILSTLTAALNRKLAAGMVVVVPEPAMAGADTEREGPGRKGRERRKGARPAPMP